MSSKYDGIEKPESKLAPAKTIDDKSKTKKRGFWHGVLIRLFVAAIFLGAIFGIAQIDTPFTNTITDGVRNLVTTSFSQGGYISSRDEFLVNGLLGLTP